MAMEADRQRVKMAESVESYRSQLRSISAQLASIKLQMIDVVTVMKSRKFYTPSDKTEVKSLVDILSMPEYDAFISVIKGV